MNQPHVCPTCAACDSPAILHLVKMDEGEERICSRCGIALLETIRSRFGWARAFDALLFSIDGSMICNV